MSTPIHHIVAWNIATTLLLDEWATREDIDVAKGLRDEIFVQVVFNRGPEETVVKLRLDGSPYISGQLFVDGGSMMIDGAKYPVNVEGLDADSGPYINCFVGVACEVIETWAGGGDDEE